MPKIVKQSVTLPARARDLYAMYLNPKIHAAITGHMVVIGARAGAPFRAFGGALSGRILQTVPGRLIVQSWRAKPFHKNDEDSTLVLRFVPAGKKGRIELVHVNVPDHDFRGVTEGWKNFYWKPWRKYLAARKA